MQGRAALRNSVLFVVVIVAFVGGYSSGQYQRFSELPWLQWIHQTSSEDHDHGSHADAADQHDHEGHDHGNESANSLELTDAGRRNLGLTDDFLKPIELTSYTRSITVPSIVVDRPGRTKMPVSAPMTGIVTHVHAVSGEAVQSGELILGMRLTHEDLVTLQKEYLQSLGDRDVELKEIERLQQVTESGAVSPRTLLERKYSRDKLDSLIRSQREALRLHGLSDSQLELIDRDRRLLTEVSILAPGPDIENHDHLHLSNESRVHLTTQSLDLAAERLNPAVLTKPNKARERIARDSHLLVIQDLKVQKGQIVNAGDVLCTLADYETLLVEGQAFEAEASLVAKVKAEGRKVVGMVGEGQGQRTIGELELAWIENEINPTSRTLKFYANLPNRLVADDKNISGQRYVQWEYRPGQRMQLSIPVETWEDQFVLPVDAVVKEGFESFVFLQNGDHFDRVSVHEKFRDTTSVVIENDGAIYPGDILALRGAHQMHMALKNKSGGGADPHAGHNH